MGILNVTPDSFFEGSRVDGVQQAVDQAGKMLEEGAAVLDIGGMSSRPGARLVAAEEEMDRILHVVEAVHRHFPKAAISVDTVWSKTVRAAWQAGAGMVNDISAGVFDPGIFEAAISLKMPYVLMHMQGTPQTMQQNPQYQDIGLEVLDFFIQHLGQLRARGAVDVVIDPGFGFGKTVEHNYSLLKNLSIFRILEVPILVGLSRKSMTTRVLGVTPAEALNGTTALHMAALERGARILRVHDVKEAVQTIRLWEQLESA